MLIKKVSQRQFTLILIELLLTISFCSGTYVNTNGFDASADDDSEESRTEEKGGDWSGIDGDLIGRDITNAIVFFLGGLFIIVIFTIICCVWICRGFCCYSKPSVQIVHVPPYQQRSYPAQNSSIITVHPGIYHLPSSQPVFTKHSYYGTGPVYEDPPPSYHDIIIDSSDQNAPQEAAPSQSNSGSGGVANPTFTP